jgi:micrococcal nuclease
MAGARRASWAFGLTLLLAGCGAAPTEPAQGREVEVVRVIDGDTIKVSGGETVRLVGIDSPESKRPNTPVECGAKRAASALRALLAGKTVLLRPDPTQDATDRYGRTLAYVDIGSRDAGEVMVRTGWAKPYVYRGIPFDRVREYRAAEAAARASRAGVHGACAGDFHRAAG